MKKYPSTSQRFLWVYVFSVLLAGLMVYAITFTTYYAIISMISVFLIFLPMVFFYRNSYAIDNRRFLRFSSRSKSAKPSIVIDVALLRKLEKIQKSGQTIGLNVYDSSGRKVNLMIKEAEEFAQQLIDLNPNLENR